MNIAVVTWGRMNPPTVGHQKLINFIKQKAREVSGTPLLFVSKTEGNEKNPLKYRDKLAILRLLFGKIVQEQHTNNVFDVFEELSKRYSKLIIVVGQDRVEEFEKMMRRCVPKYFSIDWEVLSCGNRNGGSSVEGISGTKMRHFVCINNYNMFRHYLPEKAKPIAKEIFSMIKNPDDDKDLTEYVLDFQQRHKRGMSMKRHSSRIEVSRERLARRPADMAHLKKRARAKALMILKQKFAGPNGAKYADLSVSQKIQVDKRVDKKKALVARLAMRLLPKVRQADSARLHTLSTHPAMDESVDDRFTKMMIEDVNNKFENLFEAESAADKKKQKENDAIKATYDNLTRHRQLRDFHKKAADMYASRGNRYDTKSENPQHTKKYTESLKKAEEHEDAFRAHEVALLSRDAGDSSKAHNLSKKINKLK